MRYFLIAFPVLLAASWLSPARAADTPPDSPGAKATREKKLTAKLKLDIDKKMLRPIIQDDLPTAVKEMTGLTLKIDVIPGQGVTLTSSFELKGDMTLEEALDRICKDKSWGWYINSTKVGDQKDGMIYITTNSKEHGYKEGTAAKDDPKDKPKDKTKDKSKDDPKPADGEKAATELYSKAKLLVNLKQIDKAQKMIDDILEKYPDTKAAADAKKLREKIGK